MKKLLFAVPFVLFVFCFGASETEMLEEQLMLEKEKQRCSKSACDPLEILQLINIISPEKFNELKDKNLSVDELLKIAEEEVAKQK